MTPGRFDGKVAIVTGASSGIGEATARRLAADGAHVVLVARREQALREIVESIEGDGGEASHVAVDITEIDAPERAVAAALAAGDRLDILVNCAGLFEVVGFREMSDTSWDRMIATDLTAPMRFCRAAADHLTAARGAIVNVSSINALIADPASVSVHYNAAKAGLDAVTRQLAVEMAPDVRVTSVAPGVVATPILGDWLHAAPTEWLERFVPLRRLGRPSELAGVVSFLASEDAGYITGTTVVADGGYTTV